MIKLVRVQSKVPFESESKVPICVPLTSTLNLMFGKLLPTKVNVLPVGLYATLVKVVLFKVLYNPSCLTTKLVFKPFQLVQEVYKFM